MLPESKLRARITTPALSLLILMAAVPKLRSEQYYFDIDPLQSYLNASATINLPELGAQVLTQGQGSNGLAVPIYSDGTAGQLDGILAADINWSTSRAVFGGGVIHGLPSGLWEPGFLGSPGVQQGFLGFLIDGFLGLPARGVGAIRDFRADYRDVQSLTALTPSGEDAFTFATHQWLAVSANVDIQGQAGIAAALGSQRYVLNDRFADRNSGHLGQLERIGADEWSIHVPLDLRMTINGELDGIGAINIAFAMQGQIVGRSITLPTETIILQSIPGNDSIANAQNVNSGFARYYDASIGDTITNTSAAFPHVTIEGTGDGTFDYFSFTIGEPGTAAFFDIDGATFDAELFLYDSEGNLLAFNDDAPSTWGGTGSQSSLDPFLEYTFLEAGTYTIAVGQYDSFGGPNGLVGAAPPVGGTYTLHISVVPETSTILLTLLGGGGMLVVIRRAKARSAGPQCGFTWIVILGVAMLTVPASANPLIKPSIESIFDAGAQYEMPYRLFLPQGLDESTESFPLVLFLHGGGERGIDNFFQVSRNIDGLIQATQGETYSSFLLAPQVTDYPFAGGWNAASPYDRTMEILQHVMSAYPVDPSRIYITGLSMGGYGTFDYVADFPDLFAAAAPLAGGGSTATAADLIETPMWVFHGALDSVVPVQNSRNMVNAMIDAGGDPLYTEYPAGRHDIWHTVYSSTDFYEWMFSQSRAPAATVPEASTFVFCLFPAIGIGIAYLRKKNHRAPA